MLIRKLAMGLALVLAASLSGCKCCQPGCNTCGSPALIAGAPPASCNSCGPGPASAVVVPPPPGAVVPAPAPVNPGVGPYGASYPR
jgi:hypothetical protein